MYTKFERKFCCVGKIYIFMDMENSNIFCTEKCNGDGMSMASIELRFITITEL
jgi:hypothetical protein